MDCELTSGALGLMEVELWLHLEDELTDLDANWFQFGCNFVAWGHYLAEVVIVDAVKIRSANIFLPLFSQEVESLLWYSEVGAAGVDDCWVFLLLSESEFFASVEHVSAFKGPLFNRVHPVWPIRHSLNFLKTTDSSNNLVGVETAEDGVRVLGGFWSSDAEADNSLVDNFLVLE